MVCLSEDEVIVRCQCVLGSDIELVPHSSDNGSPPCLNQRYRDLVLETMKPRKLHEDTHNQLMVLVSLQEGLDYEEECSDSKSGKLSGESEESSSGSTDEDIDDSSSSDDSK